MNFILERLKEKSTWISIVTFITSAGLIQLKPEMAEQVAIAGGSIVSLALAIMKEK